MTEKIASLDSSWQILQQKAKPTDNWLKFWTEEEVKSIAAGTTMAFPFGPTVSAIPINQPLWMGIDLEFNRSQLLLLNRSQDGQALLCPSLGYAPNPIIRSTPVLLPQKKSWADIDEERFTFETAGTEEFLAIVLRTHIDLPWLILTKEEDLLEWDTKKFSELLEQLSNLNDWEVFYQSFEVTP